MPTADQKLLRVFRALLSVAQIEHGQEFLAATGHTAPRITISGTITLDQEHYDSVMEEIMQQTERQLAREAATEGEQPS